MGSDSTAVDPRVVRTREVVLAAAVEVLTDVGFERVSIDAIAERSGVARSTIYRNWPDRDKLLAEAFQQAHGKAAPRIETTGELRSDLRQLADALVGSLTSDAWACTVPSLIGAAIHGESIRDLAASFSEDRRKEARQVLTVAAGRGEIGLTDQIDSALERFVAPFFVRRLVSQLPLDEGFVETQVEATLAQLGARRAE